MKTLQGQAPPHNERVRAQEARISMNFTGLTSLESDIPGPKYIYQKHNPRQVSLQVSIFSSVTG